MADLETQRTLVKSPPELWAEVSNPAALGRRLADFGEIRITRLIPEQTVAWEGDRASGTVELEASGWGTKVRLTASAHADAPGPPAPADRITAVIVPDDEDDRFDPRPPTPPVRVTGRPSAAERSAARMASRAAAAAAASAATAPDPARVQPGSRPDAKSTERAPSSTAPKRPGFLARLFGRRRAARATAVGAPAPSVAPEEPPSAAAIEAPVPVASVPENPRPEEAEAVQRYAQPMEGPRALDAEQTMAVLSSVLDDLGAAHHRPFSRE